MIFDKLIQRGAGKKQQQPLKLVQQTFSPQQQAFSPPMNSRMLNNQISQLGMLNNPAQLSFHNINMINPNVKNPMYAGNHSMRKGQEGYKSQQATPLLQFYDTNGFFQQNINMSMNISYTPQLKPKQHHKKNKKDPFLILKTASAMKDSLDDEANRINLESVRFNIMLDPPRER
jgi:hypothetical protein